MKHESIRSAFDWNTGEPSIFRPLQAAQNLRTSATERVEKRRAAGDQSMLSIYVHTPAKQRRRKPSNFPTIESAQGLNHGRPPKLYTTPGLVTPTSTSLPVVNAEQGSQDHHRRDALRRGGI